MDRLVFPCKAAFGVSRNLLQPQRRGRPKLVLSGMRTQPDGMCRPSNASPRPLNPNHLINFIHSCEQLVMPSTDLAEPLPCATPVLQNVQPSSCATPVLQNAQLPCVMLASCLTYDGLLRSH
eukprot:1159209-Pelagomonas_calceolata.AAC.8